MFESSLAPGTRRSATRPEPQVAEHMMLVDLQRHDLGGDWWDAGEVHGDMMDIYGNMYIYVPGSPP